MKIDDEIFNSFYLRLRRFLKKDFSVKIVNSKGVLLSFSPVINTLSIHKNFLYAPDDILSIIAHFVLGKERKKERGILKYYFYNMLRQSIEEPSKNLVSQGAVYNLKDFYDENNKIYFDNSLNLKICWFKAKKSFSRITLGEFDQMHNLVKIHPLLDNKIIPSFFLKFVIYHEMLHSTVFAKLRDSGRLFFHSKDFKEKEKMFEEYQSCISWEKENKKILFHLARNLV